MYYLYMHQTTLEEALVKEVADSHLMWAANSYTYIYIYICICIIYIYIQTTLEGPPIKEVAGNHLMWAADLAGRSAKVVFSKCLFS